jgi:hypothetical protein
MPITLPIIDVHTHLAGLGHGGTGCFISERKFHSLLYKMMRRKLGIYDAHRDGRLDQAYLERLEKDVRAGIDRRALSACVVFAHDRIYDDSGELRSRGQELYVPNDYAFAVCERGDLRGLFCRRRRCTPIARMRWKKRTDGSSAAQWR